MPTDLYQDGVRRAMVTVTIRQPLDIEYIAFLGACHDDFTPGMTSRAFRKLVGQVLAARGSYGDQDWRDALSEIDDEVYTAALATAARTYGFDEYRLPTPREGEK